MISETDEMQDALHKEMELLKARLAVAEQQRLSGVKNYSLDDAEKMMRDIVDSKRKNGGGENTSHIER
ncbi:MAG: hypothetical protein FWD37_01745 [Methanomassiliicoccaceae archaeon]|nr:hypothetical protein [Methanomassiliicoccaceae archaeon]